MTQIGKSLFAVLPFMMVLLGCGGGFDVAGVWTGKMVQPEGPQGQQGYTLVLDLKQAGHVVKGTSRIEIPDSGYFGVMSIEGLMANDTLHFREVEILDQKPRTRWCLKEGALKLDSKVKRLVGSWTAEGCTPGEIDVSKTQ